MAGCNAMFRTRLWTLSIGALFSLGCLADTAPAFSSDFLEEVGGTNTVESVDGVSGGSEDNGGGRTMLQPPANGGMALGDESEERLVGTADDGAPQVETMPADSEMTGGSVSGAESVAGENVTGRSEPPIRYLGVDTALSSVTAAAGERVEVICTPVTVDDRVSPPLNYIIESRPDTGLAIDGTTVTALRSGRYLITCTVPDLNLRDLQPEELTVSSGPLDRIGPITLPQQVVAGQNILVACDGFDAQGNAREVATPYLEAVPTAGGDSFVLAGDILILEAVGSYLVRCSSGRPDDPNAIRSGVVPLEVIADVIARLEGCPDTTWPDAVKPGSPIEPCVNAYDRFGNVASQRGINWTIDPGDGGVELLAPGQFLPQVDGQYTLTASASSEDDNESVLIFDLLVDGTPPTIRCGVGLEDRGHPADQDLTVRGDVLEASGLRSFNIGGAAYNLSEAGAFEVSYDVDYGINNMGLDATDLAGNQSRNQCIFLGVSRNWDSDVPIENALQFELRQRALDDGQRSSEINSLGDLFDAVVDTGLVVDLIDEGLAAQEFPAGLTYRRSIGASLSDDPSVRLTYLSSDRDCAGDECTRTRGNLCDADVQCEVPYDCLTVGGVDGMRCAPRRALRMVLALEKLEIPVRRGCGRSGRVLADLRLSNAVMEADFAFDVDANRLQAELVGQPSVTFGNITVENVDRSGGFGNFTACLTVEGIIRTALGLDSVFGFIRDPLVETTQDLLDDELTSILSDVLGSIDFGGLLGSTAVTAPSGDQLSVDFGSRLHDAYAGTDALVLDIESDVRVTSTLYGADDLTALGEFGVGLGNFPDLGGGVPLIERPNQPDAPGQQPDAGVSIVVDISLFNRLLYGLWKLNFFAINSETGLLGDALDVDLSLGGPPVVEGLVSEQRARLFLVPMVGRLAYPGIIDTPFPFKMGTSILFDINLEEGTLSFGGNIEIEDFILVIENADLGDAQAAAIENDLRTMLENVISDVLGSALPTIAIPAIALPDSLEEYGVQAGQNLRVSDPSLAVGHPRIFLEGNLSQ